MTKAATAVATNDDERVSYNLLGQRLGRKGRDTRDRILAATERLLASEQDVPISLSAVAREASLGMTTLYLYFSDLTELLLALLEPIMASAEDSYIGHLRDRWPDEGLTDHCLRFVTAHHDFWVRHSRILLLRNSLADARDVRMIQHRVSTSEPLIRLLVQQMGGDPRDTASPERGTAAVLLTGIERLLSVHTDFHLANLLQRDPGADYGYMLRAEARLLELGIRDHRAARR